ncbi:Hypothetical predicted protein [Paramuricea clavata]|uniref:Reverse transcriptase domain-containing protein n=1 Tax=Paramuricea clavata TaxID=317549 RepID=A0A7D9E3D9_PARCT|nr:Hypothetical predicted protein [Paramuricea clavata]
MWRNINQLIGKTSKTTNVTSVKSNDQIFTNNHHIAETFNDYFSKIGTEFSNRIPPSNKGFEEYLERSVSPVFEFKSVSNDEVETVLTMYADDTNLSVTGESASDIEVRLNTELENVHEWLTANKLTINTEKTEYMIIGSYKRISNIQKEDEIKIRIGDNEIKRVKTTKSLGIVIDEE